MRVQVVDVSVPPIIRTTLMLSDPLLKRKVVSDVVVGRPSHPGDMSRLSCLRVIEDVGTSFIIGDEGNVHDFLALCSASLLIKMVNA